MRSTVLIRGLGGTPEKKERELNERIAEKEKEGWEVVDMQVSSPAFGSQAVIVVRLAMESS
jgi:translation elongation factor EF-1beta